MKFSLTSSVRSWGSAQRGREARLPCSAGVRAMTRINTTRSMWLLGGFLTGTRRGAGWGPGKPGYRARESGLEQMGCSWTGRLSPGSNFGADLDAACGARPGRCPGASRRPAARRCRLADQHPLACSIPSGVERALEPAGQLRLPLALDHAGDSSAARSVNASRASCTWVTRVAVLRQHRHHAHRGLVVGQRAGQHGPDLARDRGRLNSGHRCRWSGPRRRQLLVGKAAMRGPRRARPGDPPGGRTARRKPRRYAGDSRRPASGRPRPHRRSMGGPYDVVHRVLDPHLAETSCPAPPGLDDLLHGDSHLGAPFPGSGLRGPGGSGLRGPGAPAQRGPGQRGAREAGGTVKSSAPSGTGQRRPGGERGQVPLSSTSLRIEEWS